ncbi:MAG: putative glycoside hydrolase [Spirochaetota bacterium]
MTKKRIILTAAITAAVTGLCTITGLLLASGSRNHSFTIIDPRYNRPHVYTYKDLPSGFSYSAGTLLYKTQSDTDTKKISAAALKYTRFYKSLRLEKALREYNSLSGTKIQAGTILYIPFSLPALMPDMKNRSRSPLIFTRGLYYTGTTAGSGRILSQLDDYEEAGINTVVFDAKDITGIVNYNSGIPDVIELNTSSKRSIDDIDKLIRELKSRNIYIIARIACFRDQLVAKNQPQWAIRSKKTGGTWSGSGEIWCDPTNREMQDYNLQIAIELAEKGVDEIQFDYIRFPTAGDFTDAKFAWSGGATSNERCIEQYLQRVHGEMSQRNVNFSIDVFGIVAWGHEKDIVKTGQRIELLAKWCDVISPMLYPSHFNDNFDGYAKPGDAPYYFINAGCRKFSEKAGSTPIRPWLQAFGWRVSNYNASYITEQIRGSNDANACGYLFWNAGNNYDLVLKAMKEIRAGKNKISMSEADRTKGGTSAM